MKKKQPLSFIDSGLQVRDLIDFLPDATFAINSNNQMIIWNHEMELLTGISATDMLCKKKGEYAKSFYNHKPPMLVDLVCESDDVIRQHYPNFVRSRDTISAKVFIPSLKENGIYLWAFAKPLYDQNDNVIGAIESLRDISELKKTDNTIKSQKEELETVNQDLLMANQELQLSEEKFSKAFNLGPVIITISRVSDGQYVAASNFFLKTTGYTREEVIGRTSIELNIWKNEEDRKKVIETVMKTGVVHELPVQFQSKSKRIYLMLFSAEIVNIGEEPHFVSVAIDITERQKAKEERDQMEKQMHQAQKMESIGRLAGGVAHDFNNLLTAIIGSTQMLMASELGEKNNSRLEVILKAADSATDLTRQLLAFSRKQIIEPRLMDLNINVRHMTKMLMRMIGEDIRLSTRIDVPEAPIIADPGQVEQIIVNLAVNARDAMPDGGALILQITEVVLDASYCKSRPYVLPGVYMALTVSDTGMGIKNEDNKKIFEPFYTTKPPGKGTGLGLATVYGAVKQNNGSIEVYSVPEKGTSFKIYFPKVSTHGEALPAEEMQDLPAVGFETILLVEDDTLVRELAVESLKQLGYLVLETSNAEDALKIAKDYDGEIHLLFTDVILPGMNGKSLADALMIIRPDTPVLFTSGYTGDLIDHHGILNKAIAFIEKPYTIYSLSQKIRKTLSSVQK